MKWLPRGAKVLAHPSLLPIALATFVSVAGPGGIAEFGSNMPTGTIVAVAPESPPALVSEQPDALLVRVVLEQTAPVGPVVEAETPQTSGTEELVATAGDASATDERVAGTEGDPQIAPALEPDQQSPDSGDPPADSNTPEQPEDNPNNTGGGAGDAGDDGDQPADDGGSVTPPQDDGNAGEEPRDGDSGGNGTDDTSEGACDIPGNGHEKQDLEPGHDKNNDGIDDRCQQDEGDDEGAVDGECDVPGNGHDEHDVGPGHDKNDDGIDDRCQRDEGDDEGTVGACDVPGNGHEKHDAEPGHDKNNDGVDDRCQEGEGDTTGPTDGACDEAQGNGHDKDGDGLDDHCNQNDASDNNDGTADDGHDRNDGREDEG
jgi:hypothetical protein